MRDEKQFLLDEIEEKISNSNGFIVARYQGLNAAKARTFRDIVTAANGEFEVVRKRIFLKALEKQGVALKMDDFEGHVGVIFAKNDAAALTKVTVKYSEENDDTFKVLGGKIEHEVYSAQDMVAISTLPGIAEIRSQILGMLEGPMRDVVSIFGAHLSGLLNCLDAKAKKEEK
jgi:large subunit ribosomal protein L10